MQAFGQPRYRTALAVEFVLDDFSYVNHSATKKTEPFIAYHNLRYHQAPCTQTSMNSSRPTNGVATFRLLILVCFKLAVFRL